MSYELATAYAETFHQDPSWFTRPPLPESTSSELLAQALHRGSVVTREEADSAYKAILGYACPNEPMRISEDGTLVPWKGREE